MEIYYIEYRETVKFFKDENTIEIEKTKILELFIKTLYKKYGKDVKFKCLV